MVALADHKGRVSYRGRESNVQVEWLLNDGSDIALVGGEPAVAATGCDEVGVAAAYDRLAGIGCATIIEWSPVD